MKWGNKEDKDDSSIFSCVLPWGASIAAPNSSKPVEISIFFDIPFQNHNNNNQFNFSIKEIKFLWCLSAPFFATTNLYLRIIGISNGDGAALCSSITLHPILQHEKRFEYYICHNCEHYTRDKKVEIEQNHLTTTKRKNQNNIDQHHQATRCNNMLSYLQITWTKFSAKLNLSSLFQRRIWRYIQNLIKKF